MKQYVSKGIAVSKEYNWQDWTYGLPQSYHCKIRSAVHDVSAKHFLTPGAFKSAIFTGKDAKTDALSRSKSTNQPFS